MNGFTKTQHAYVALRDLHAHPQVQRRFDPAWARKLRDSFDPDKFGTITVVKTGEKHFVIDGQHRVAAAKESLGEDQKVPCIIYPDMPLQRQADLFLGRNTAKAVRAIDKFKQAVNAGNAHETEITKVLAGCGLKLDEPRLSGVVRSPGALLKVYGRIGAVGLRRTLTVIKAAWGTEPDAYDGVIIRAIGDVLRRFATEVEDDDFSRKLCRNGGPSHLLGRARDFAKAAGIHVERAMVERMVNIYNKGRRTKVLSLGGTPPAQAGAA